MSVRRLSKDDLALLMELYRHLHETDDPPPTEDMAGYVWSTILASDNIRYFGKSEGEKLVSACSIIVIPNLTRGCSPYGLIENVVTHKLYRRRGYGQAVLKCALGFAWDRDCYKVMLMTGRQDEATYRFYESAGFVRNEKEAFIAKPPNP